MQQNNFKEKTERHDERNNQWKKPAKSHCNLN